LQTHDTLLKLAWLADSNDDDFSKEQFPFATTPLEVMAVQAFTYLLHHYFAHLKTSVTTGVRADMDESDDRVGRQRALTKWMRSSTLSSLNGDSKDINHLIQLLATTTDDIEHGLPHIKSPDGLQFLSYRAVAKAIASQIAPGSTTKARAPFFPRNNNIHAMRIASDMLLERLGKRTPEEITVWLTNMVAMTLRGNNICFLPWNTNTRAGALWNHWICLRDEGPQQMLENLDVEGTVTRQIKQNKAVKTGVQRLQELTKNPDEWSVDTFNLKDLGTLLQISRLPKYCPASPKKKQKNEYVEKTYRWVERNWDPTNPKHRYALLASVLLAKLSPSIGSDKHEVGRIGWEVPKLAPNEDTQTRDYVFNKTQEILDTLSWAKVAGKDSEGSLAAGFLTLSVALMEEESPLRQEMSEGGGLGRQWLSQHSELLPPYYP
jgi:hypothetical protein